jgi:hypothetical protein
MSSHSDGRWLYSPLPDYVLGCGLVYVPLFLMLLFAGPQVEAWLPLSLMPLIVLAFNTPHIGATLLRVYEREEDRRAYKIFALYITLAIAALCFGGLYVPIIGSVLITLYITIVPWHFTGQNYGIAAVFLRRRGVELEAGTKRCLHFSFITTYLITLIALHGEVLSDAYAPLGSTGAYRFLALGIPKQIVWVLLALLGVAYAYFTSETLMRLRRVASWRDIAPAIALMGTQALWYSVPVLVYFFTDPKGIFPLDPAHYGYTFLWVNQVHAVQYLWITSYYARRSDPSYETPRYLGKALLMGSAVYGITALLLAPGLVGPVAFDSGLYLMLAGALNLHHVVLDSAIWKLRSPRLAKILLRPAEPAPGALEAARRSWLRPAIYASGALGIALGLVGTVEAHFGYAEAVKAHDLTRLERAADRLAWMGRESPHLYTEIAVLRAEQGDVAGALEALERGVAVHPTAPAWLNIGHIRERRGDHAGALEAYQAAARIAPEREEIRARVRQAANRQRSGA